MSYRALTVSTREDRIEAPASTDEGISARFLVSEFSSYPQSRTSAELVTDCEEKRTLRAVLGMLRESEQLGPS